MTTPQYPYSQQPGQFPPPPGYPGAVPPAGGLTSPSVGSTSPRPKEVTISFWLWVTSSVIGLAGLIFFVAEYDTIREAAVEDTLRQASRERGLDEAQLQTLATIILVVTAVVRLFIIATQLLLAFLMRKGRNWARSVLAVIGGLSLLLGLLSLGGAPGSQLVVSTVSLSILAGALVTMFLPGANPWFRRPLPQF